MINSLSNKTLGFDGVVIDQSEFQNIVSKIVDNYDMKI